MLPKAAGGKQTGAAWINIWKFLQAAKLMLSLLNKWVWRRTFYSFRSGKNPSISSLTHELAPNALPPGGWLQVSDHRFVMNLGRNFGFTRKLVLWLVERTRVNTKLFEQKKKIINVYILKCIQAHNYVSWQPKHIISSDSTLGTWQTATHTSIHASANNNISFVRQREAILCKTDCMERKIIPFMPFPLFFLHSPTHTQIKLYPETC